MLLFDKIIAHAEKKRITLTLKTLQHYRYNKYLDRLNSSLDPEEIDAFVPHITHTILNHEKEILTPFKFQKQRLTILCTALASPQCEPLDLIGGVEIDRFALSVY
jgi:hypothetical protein